MNNIYNPNQRLVEPKHNGAGVITYDRNFWMETGHCRRCDNGLGHTLRRRGAGGERPSGVILQRPPGRHIYEDETAGIEKVKMRRKARHRDSAEMRNITRENT